MQENRKNNEKVPNSRFPEFEGEWTTMNFGEVAEFKVTNSFSRKNLNYENGAVKNIHYGDIHTKFQILFDITKEIVPYINEDISIDKISEDFYCREGDIVFADASEDLNDVGKSIEILNLNNEKLLSGLHTLLARPRTSYFQKGFIGYLFKSNSVRYQIQKEAQGSKVLSINVGRISKISLSFPNLPEQEKIASLLLSIDIRIQTQIKIIENLESLMKGLSQKIFTQQVRFKNDKGDSFPKWKMKKLGEISIIKRGASPRPIRSSKWFSEKSNVGWVRISDVTAAKSILNYTTQYLSKAGIEKSRFVPKGNIIMSICATIGKPMFTGFDVCIHDGFVVFEKLTANEIFFYYLLQKIKNNWYEYGQPGIQLNLNSDIVNNEKVIIPCLEEQTKIANFLSSLDEKIESERKLLQQYEQQQMYLLQNMFI